LHGIVSSPAQLRAELQKLKDEDFATLKNKDFTELRSKYEHWNGYFVIVIGLLTTLLLRAVFYPWSLPWSPIVTPEQLAEIKEEIKLELKLSDPSLPATNSRDSSSSSAPLAPANALTPLQSPQVQAAGPEMTSISGSNEKASNVRDSVDVKTDHGTAGNVSPAPLPGVPSTAGEKSIESAKDLSGVPPIKE
jgi:hypothetical protein